MLSLKQFRSMADSYGADLRRWPEEIRDGARALCSTSAEARAILERARALDEALATANAVEAAAGTASAEEAALARIRARVRTRIAAGPKADAWRSRWIALAFGPQARSSTLRWTGMAAAWSLAVAAGLLLGTLYSPAPHTDNVIGLLQPVPIHLFAE